MGTDLATIDRERLGELVATIPVRKRPAFTKALQAAAQYAKDRKNYAKACELAIAVLENEWHLGRELPKVLTRGAPRKKGDKNHLYLGDIGISGKRSQLAQVIARYFTKPQLTKWAEGVIEGYKDDPLLPPMRFPRISSAAIEAKRRGKKKQVEEVALPTGQYDTIVIDPPWPMEKIERPDERQNQTGFDYAVMEEDDMAAIEIPATDDCHMWVWTTHRFLPMSIRLVAKWGFKYVCTFVWHKPGGFQPFNLPQYNCEFAIYCRKGSPQFVDTKAFNVCFESERGKHSEKPEGFYEVIVRVCGLSARRRGLDMFNRRKLKYFDGWGSEAAT